MTIAERDVAPRESDQQFLVECWKQCLVEMIADVRETKLRWKDASELLKAESAAAIAEARAAFSDTLIKLEHSIDERLRRLRQIINQKSRPPVRAYVEDKVHYEGELVTHDGSTYRALCDTGRAPPDEEHWCRASQQSRCMPGRRLAGALLSRAKGTSRTER